MFATVYRIHPRADGKSSLKSDVNKFVQNNAHLINIRGRIISFNAASLRDD